MDNKLIHHSLADWDFSQPSWEITIADFVSPPSSLRIWSFATHNFLVLCKASCALKLPQGRIITYYKIPPPPMFVRLYFRNISIPGLAFRDSTYEVDIDSYADYWAIHEYHLGDLKREWLSPRSPWDNTQWTHIRLTWWQTWDVLLVRLEREIDTVWTPEGDDITISNALFTDAPYQRPGVGSALSLNHNYVYFDDTEIWLPS